ncbi:MAG: hypothetical protein DRO01_04835 [Thermoproteota archaeon]|nr:MAG: hypothetical protein DRO01_04835 [Candidatus Korarchaeota archaeon]
MAKKQLIAFALSFFFLAGCASDRQVVSALDKAWRLVAPEYAAYVQKDPDLTDYEKKVRLKTVQLTTELLDEYFDRSESAVESPPAGN